MKAHIISADGRQQIDPTLMGSLLSHLPQTQSSAEADAVIVPVSHHPDYTFNAALLKLSAGKKVVVIDLMEYYGRVSATETHLFGVNPDAAHNLSGNPEWVKLHQWLADRPPVLYFKRELLVQNQNERVLPIEWPCLMGAWPIESRDAFDKRPFQVFYNWGYSNGLRPRLAAEIYQLMAQGKIEVIASFDHIDAALNKTNPRWVSIHSPHTHRTHIDRIMVRQAQSKMSVSMPGAGQKCFRSTEAPVHTVPVMVQDGIAWSYPWVDGLNCLKIHSESVETMAEQMWHDAQCSALYDLYVEAQQTIDKYRTHRYVPEYIIPAIQRCL